MAKQAEHEKKARHNESLIPKIEALNDYPDWATTAKFYAAVHWLRALLARHSVGTHPTKSLHYDDFGPEILRLLCPPPAQPAQTVIDALDAFDELRDLARASRYHCLRDGEYHRAALEGDTALKKIRKFVEGQGVQVDPTKGVQQTVPATTP